MTHSMVLMFTDGQVIAPVNPLDPHVKTNMAPFPCVIAIFITIIMGESNSIQL